ncbi:MAG: MFS transporter [Micrococcaceae bacterium]
MSDGTLEPLESTSALDSKEVDKSQVFAWSLWEWGSGAFNTIITTFVFSVYLTDQVAKTETEGSQALGWGMGLGGLLIALLAPVTGQRSDRGGRRKLWLGVNTAAVCVTIACGFFVKPDPKYLVPGIAVIAIANIFFQFAEVNNNAILLQVSNKKSLGKISGFGWGMGYVGGIVALLIALVGFATVPKGKNHSLFGVPTAESLNIRALCIFAAVWFFVSMLPLLYKVPEIAPRNIEQEKETIAESYKKLWATVKRIYKEDRNIIKFLISSALFRDGLAAVFQFAAILAVGTYGLNQQQVLVFAIVANLFAALGAMSAGWFDDHFGPKIVIVVSLASLMIAGIILFLVPSLIPAKKTEGFWIIALILCLFVGPAQSSSRTFLARMARRGQEGELFGLYATTGRAVSFLAPTLFALCISLALPHVGHADAQRWGIWGIIITVALGLGTLLSVSPPTTEEESPLAKAATQPRADMY